jgi:Ca2+-binding EF-hand superfamily protein
MASFADKLGPDTEAVKKKIMHRLDANKDGKLDANEFKVLFKEMLNRQLLVERARVKFMEFDTNQNGFIDTSEIKQVIE